MTSHCATSVVSQTIVTQSCVMTEVDEISLTHPVYVFLVVIGFAVI